MKNLKIPVLSFFSGGGFLDMGFEMAGFDVVWTNEIDEVFADLHSAGITSWRKSKGNGMHAEIFNTNPIDEINSKEILLEAFKNNKPNVFGIIGGPPCQDFTINGKMNGFDGDRGKLTNIYFDKILDLLPTFFLMENVTGLIRNKESNTRLYEILKPLRKKYYIDNRIMNSLDYGVPQFRERIFFVGIKKENIKVNSEINDLTPGWFSWPSKIKYDTNIKKMNWPEVNDFGIKVKKDKSIPLELCVESCLVSDSKQKKIHNADEYFNLYVHEKKLNKIKEGETNRPSFKRLHRYRYSPTACYGNNEVHLHPYKNRRLSVREALRIQGVPDEYVLPKDLPLSKKFKMIGNGVPVPLAKEIAISLKKFINNNVIS